MTSSHFEDFHVGQRFSTGSRTVTDQDLAEFTALTGQRPPRTEPDAGPPALHPPFEQAVLAGLLDALQLVDDTALGVLDSRWTHRAPVRVGATLTGAVTITRCRRAPEGDHGTITRHVRLVDQDGTTVGEGSTALAVRARTTGPDPADRAFGTVEWATELGRLAAADERFTGAVASWDGTIGLRCGADEAQLRIYRGQVIDVSRRAPHGATFTLGADEAEWTDLLTGDRDDFMRRAMRGRFRATGDGYEYLRLTKALHLLVEHARALADRGSRS